MFNKKVVIFPVLFILFFCQTALSQTSSPSFFSQAGQVRGTLLPFQFPVTATEFRRNSYGDLTEHVIEQASPLELNLRSYYGTLSDFRAQFSNPEVAQSFIETAQRIGVPQDQLRVIMRKNERGFYIPQLVRPRRRADGSLYPWDPQYPGMNMQMIDSNHENRVFRSDASGTPQLVPCPERVSLEQIQAGTSCQIPPPARARSCNFDSDIADSGKTFQEASESGINCTKGPNQPTNEYLCMACNLYFESRGEGSLGMEAVAELTLSDQAHQVRRGQASSTPICDAVYKDYRFSWTLEPAVVDVSVARDWRAWQQALFLSTQYASQSGSSNPNIHDPKLHCYRYYVSTRTFQNFDSLPSWAREYYSQTMNMGDNFRPLCIGNHVFMRDPNERNCPQPDITRTRERDMDSETFRRLFFRDCLGVNDPPLAQRTPPAPPTQLCSQNTIERAIEAHRGTGMDHSPPGINDIVPETSQ